MKKLLHLAVLLSFTSSLFAQTCDNTLPITEHFDTDVIGVCWDITDSDGDNKNWYWWEFLPAAGGYKCLVSRSFTTASGALTPDNWVVSYAIDLTNVPNGYSVELSWKVRGELSGFAHENYTIYAATGNQMTDFTTSPIKRSEYVDEVGGEAAWATRTLDVTALAGNTVYIAFRHHNSSNQYSINIDDVSITTSSTLGTEDFSSENFHSFYNADTKTLVLSSANKPIQSVQIYSILGQNILTEKLMQSEGNLNLSSLKTGVYIARVNIDGSEKSIKFIKR